MQTSRHKPPVFLPCKPYSWKSSSERLPNFYFTQQIMMMKENYAELLERLINQSINQTKKICYNKKQCLFCFDLFCTVSSGTERLTIKLFASMKKVRSEVQVYAFLILKHF